MPKRRDRLVQSARKGIKSVWNAAPIIATVVLLVGIFRTYVSPALVQSLFAGTAMIDIGLGTALGSISTGNALTSYIIGGELHAQGVSLLAVTTFIVTWVTVGVVQFPAEASILGRRFALVRNLTSVVLAVVVSVVTVLFVPVV